jgi:hypothetical protein
LRRILQRRPSGSTVLALLALFVAVGGTATAATVITGKQIRNNSVTGADIRNSSLGNADVRNGSLLARDFRRGQLPRGARGFTGATGAAGARGAAGVNGFGRLEYPISAPVTVTPGQSEEIVVGCAPGTFPTGGDGFAIDANENLVEGAVVEEGLRLDQDGAPAGWGATVHNSGAVGDIEGFAEVVCANANQVVAAKSGGRSRVK